MRDRSSASASAPASSMLAGDTISCSAPGRSTPSSPFTDGGIRIPFTDVPQLLASWMKNRPERSRRRRKCSRETFDEANTCTSTQTELPPRPIDSGEAQAIIGALKLGIAAGKVKITPTLRSRRARWRRCSSIGRCRSP